MTEFIVLVQSSLEMTLVLKGLFCYLMVKTQEHFLPTIKK